MVRPSVSWAEMMSSVTEIVWSRGSELNTMLMPSRQYRSQITYDFVSNQTKFLRVHYSQSYKRRTGMDPESLSLLASTASSIITCDNLPWPDFQCAKSSLPAQFGTGTLSAESTTRILTVTLRGSRARPSCLSAEKTDG